MATTFSGDVGYRGIVKLNDVILLATGGQVSITHDPIFSSGVWGAGYQNAAEQVAYADNYLKVEGSFDFELTKGDGFSEVKNFAFTNRGNQDGTPIILKPNGEHGFEGNGWCSSMGFSASEGAVITCNCGFSSYIKDKTSTITTGTNSNSATGTSGGTLPFAYNDLFPYWATTVTKGTTILNDITAWSCDYSSEIVMLKCCKQGTGASGSGITSTGGAPLGPDYILIGSMTGQGSYTVFKLQGSFAPEDYHKSDSLKFAMAPASDPTAAAGTILIPTAITNSASTSIQTGASYVTAEFSFTAIGDGTNPPISMSQS